MMRVTITLLVGYILTAILGVSAQAKTFNAASCSVSDVQTAINQTSNGDTVQVPGGTVTWDATVTISSSHQITLDGGGCTITWGSSGSGGMSVTAGTAYNTRITNFTFIGAEPDRTCPITITSNTSPLTSTFRFDHNTLHSGGHESAGGIIFICQNGNGPGLFDHDAFTTTNGADEMLHFQGLGASNNGGWLDVVTPGSANMIFVEDNTFTCTSATLASAFEGYYGARVVVRHNTFNNAQTEFHGGGGIGTRWWEIYNNNFINANMCFRAGSGVVFSNTNAGQMFMLQEYGTYPAEWQIGQGQELVSGTPTSCATGGPPGCDPAYVWNNGSTQLALNTIGCAAPLANMVQLNRDVYNGSTGLYSAIPATCSKFQAYWATDQNTLYKCTATNTWTAYYTPYTYPHPLTQGMAPPAPPSNLQAAPQ